MKNLKKLVLLGIAMSIMYIVVGCQGYNSEMMVANSNTLGDMQLQNKSQDYTEITNNSDMDIVPQLEQKEKQKHLPRIRLSLKGYTRGYENTIIDGCLNKNADPYIITVLINFMTAEGTSDGMDMTNNLLGIEDSIGFSENKYGVDILKKFNNKNDSINYAIDKISNTYTREYNLMTLEENFATLYPEWERFKQNEDTREQYERVIAILYRDYEVLKGEKYRVGGIN